MRITVRNQLHIKALYIIFTTLLCWVWSLSNKVEKLQRDTSNTPDTKVEKSELIAPEILDAIIMVESGGNEKAYNRHTGAIGLLQLRPIIYNKLCGLSKEEAFIPEKNLACGELFLYSLMQKYSKNVEKVLLHYNSGYKKDNVKYFTKVMSNVK